MLSREYFGHSSTDASGTAALFLLDVAPYSSWSRHPASEAASALSLGSRTSARSR